MISRFILPFFFVACSLSSCGQNTVPPSVSATNPGLVNDTIKPKLRVFTRFEREIEKFEESDRALMPKAGGILFVGSSSIRLWKTIAEDFTPLPVINRGFGGSTIGEVNYYFRRIVLKYNPKIIVFYAGENDLFHPEISVDSVVKDLNAFRDSMDMFLPQCNVFFLSIKPSPARWAFQAKFIEANNRFRAICDTDPNFTYVDIVPKMLNDKGQPRAELFRSDSLHMNKIGYADWVKTLKPYLTEAWKKTSKTK